MHHYYRIHVFLAVLDFEYPSPCTELFFDRDLFLVAARHLKLICRAYLVKAVSGAFIEKNSASPENCKVFKDLLARALSEEDAKDLILSFCKLTKPGAGDDDDHKRYNIILSFYRFFKRYQQVEHLDKFSYRLNLFCAVAGLSLPLGGLMLWSTLACLQMLQVKASNLSSFFPAFTKFFPIPFMLLLSFAMVLSLIASKVYLNNKYRCVLLGLQESLMPTAFGINNDLVRTQGRMIFARLFDAYIADLGFACEKDCVNYLEDCCLHFGSEPLRGKASWPPYVVDDYEELQRFSSRCDSVKNTAQVALALFLLGSQILWAFSTAFGFSKILDLRLSAILDIAGIGGLLLVSMFCIAYNVGLVSKRKEMLWDINRASYASQSNQSNHRINCSGNKYSIAASQESKTEIIKQVTLACGFAMLLAGRVIIAFEAAGKISFGNVVQDSSSGGMGGSIPLGLILCLLSASVFVVYAIHNIVTISLNEAPSQSPHGLPSPNLFLTSYPSGTPPPAYTEHP